MAPLTNDHELIMGNSSFTPYPELSPRPWPYMQTPVLMAEFIKDTINTKESNPKDAIGVRKAPMSAVPAAVLAELGVAMLEGACKYGKANFRVKGARASVYYDATMRHLFSWWEGEDIDPDSELSHVIKAIASLTVLRDAMIQGRITDDRPPRSTRFYEDLNLVAERILDRHSDKTPRHWTIKDEVQS